MHDKERFDTTRERNKKGPQKNLAIKYKVRGPQSLRIPLLVRESIESSVGNCQVILIYRKCSFLLLSLTRLRY